MAVESPPIQLLGLDTRSLLRSGALTPSLPSALVELVENALDAGANTVEVEVDLSSWYLRVVDNGRGMPYDKLRRVGTSRLHPEKALDDRGRPTYGQRGEALASLAALSLLSICSRTATSHYACEIVLRGSDIVSTGTTRASFPYRSGTAVVVRDLFYNLPVRRAFYSKSQLGRQLDECRRRIEALAVANSNCTFKLYQSSGSRRQVSSVSSVAVESLCHINGTGRPWQTFCRVMRHQSYGDPFILAKRSDGYSMVGFFGTSASSRSLQQLIYVNGRLIEPCSPAYKAFSHLKRPRRAARSPSRTLSSTSPSKADTLLPLCLIFIDATSLEPGVVAACLAEDARIIALVEQAVGEYSKQQNFTSSDQGPYVDRPPLAAIVDASPPRTPPRRDPTPVGFSVSLSHRKALSSEPRVQSPLDSGNPRGRARDAHCTPSSFTQEARRSHHEADNFSHVTLAFRHRLATSSRLPNAGIVSLQQSPPLAAPTFRNVRSFFEGSTFPQKNASPSDPLSRDVLKLAEFVGQVDRKFLLCRAFLSPAQGSPRGHCTLFLVDQHAAHERVRVESLMRSLFCGEVGSTRLPRPIGATLSDAASSRNINNALAQLHTIGFACSLDESAQANADRRQVWMSAVPTVLADRLATDQETAQILLRAYFDGGNDCAHVISPYQEATLPSWMHRAKSYPPLLVDLVNSIACRGAIMFGDTMEPEESQQLLATLAKTSFPFVCAHGRPCVAPLLGVDVQSPVADAVGVDWSRL